MMTVQVAVRSPTAAATALAESAVVAEQRGTVVQYAEAQARAFAYASTQIAVEAWSAAVARSIAYSRASVVVYGRSFYRCAH